MKAMAEAMVKTKMKKFKKERQWVVCCPKCDCFGSYDPDKEGQKVYCPRCRYQFTLERPLMF